jgi:outer membrane scaffolding protein for murein synthesis (MipA/OmpV family)
LTVFLSCLLGLPGAGWAQAPGDALSGGDFVIAGVGLAAMPRYEGASDYQLLPVPGAIGQVSGIAFTAVGNRASADLLTVRLSDRWHAAMGPVAALGLNRTHLSVVKDARIRALGKVGMAVELGGSVGLVGRGVVTSAYDRLSVSLAVRHDVAGGHEGTLVEPTITYLAPLSRKLLVLVVAQADRADDRYAATYFTVTPAQSAASGLPAFAARGGWKNATLGLAIDRSLTGDVTHGLSLVAGGAWTRLMGDFADSPVTRLAGKRDQWMGGVGLAWTF